jgi:hypothetical protein
VTARTALVTLAAVLWLAAYRLPLRSARRRQRVRLAIASRTGIPARYALPIAGTATYLSLGLLAVAGVAAVSGVDLARLLAWRPSLPGLALVPVAVLGAHALTGFAMTFIRTVSPRADIAGAVTGVRWVQQTLELPGRWRWIVPMVSGGLEEYFFRGVALAALAGAGLPLWACVLVSGALFTAGQTLLASGPLSALVLAVSSVVLSIVGGALTVCEGSALPAMLVHASFAGYYTRSAFSGGTRGAATASRRASRAA